MSLEDEVRAQTQSIDRLVSTLGKQGGGSAGGSGGGDAGKGSAVWQSVTTGASNAFGALTKFTTGTYSASDALTNFGQLAGFLGPVAGTVGNALGKVGEAGLVLNKSLNDVGKSGANFNNNIGLYDKAVLGARMSLPEFEGRIKEGAQGIAGMSYNMNTSSLAFLSIGKKIQESDIAYNLQATGMGAEEFGNILTLVAHNSRGEDMKNASVQKSLRDTTLALATEMDNTARLTGLSRQEQQKSLEQQVKSLDFELASMAMSKEEREAQYKNLESSRKYGQSMQDAIKIYALGGPMNDEETKKINALGPEMQDAARRLAEVKGNTSEDEAKRKAILEEMDTIAEKKAANKSELEQMQRLSRTGDETAKAMAKAYLETARYGQIMAQANREAKPAGKTREQFTKEQLAQQDKDRIAAGKGTATGSEGEAAIPGQTANKADRLIKDVSAAVGENMTTLNTKTGQLITSFEGLNKVLRPYTAEQLGKKMPGDAIEAAKKKLAIEKVEVPADEKNKKDVYGRADGSLGAVGKLIEDFGAGTPMMLHGKEGVITEKQLHGMMGGMQSGLSSAMESAKKSMPSMDSIQTMMGSGTKDLQEAAKTQMDAAKAAVAPTQSSYGGDSATTSDLLTSVNDLNKRMERLIMAVEDGHSNSVRAIKSRGNMIS